MHNKNKQKLYEYTYTLKDAWGDTIEIATEQVLAEDMRDAVDRAIQTIQLRYFIKYEYPMYVDILEIKVLEER